MSRTIRFRKKKDAFIIRNQQVLTKCVKEKVRRSGMEWTVFHYLPLDPKSVEGRLKLARFHSDKKHYVMIRNGPAWFHLMASQRPHRQKARQSIIRFMRGIEEDVVIESKPHREYWL